MRATPQGKSAWSQGQGRAGQGRPPGEGRNVTRASLHWIRIETHAPQKTREVKRRTGSGADTCLHSRTAALQCGEGEKEWKRQGKAKGE